MKNSLASRVGIVNNIQQQRNNWGAMPTTVFSPNRDWWAKRGNLSVQLSKSFNLPTLQCDRTSAGGQK
ncbi:MAG: hypothetical protein F6K14_02575 [Symploca sp. SIO2C1]|nr:hypothetical protein [Symploca sp. SIO2C1]